jgi:alpha-beta hydrolase superfamily lysophospholipase
MRKEEFTIESRDGKKTAIHCVKWIPDGQPVCILQIVHGMAEYAERYEPFAKWLCDRGFLVTGDDHLGHGKTAVKREDLGYFCETDPATVVVRDVHRLKKTVQAQYPGVPIFILGHSMGSFIVRNYICRYGTGIQGAIIMGTGMTPKGLLKLTLGIASIQEKIYGSHHISESLNKLAFSSYNKQIPNPRTSFDWLSVNEENVDKYIADDLCGNTFTVNGFRTLFELIYRLHLPEYLNKMPKDLPVLFISGSEDPVGNYGAAVKGEYDRYTNELGMNDVTLKMIEGSRHEILNEKNHEEVYEYVLEWIRVRTK